MNEAKSLLLIASLDVVQINAEHDGKNYSEVDLEVNITVPRAVAGMAATGFDLAQWLWEQRIRGCPTRLLKIEAAAPRHCEAIVMIVH